MEYYREGIDRVLAPGLQMLAFVVGCCELPLVVIGYFCWLHNGYYPPWAEFKTARRIYRFSL